MKILLTGLSGRQQGKQMSKNFTGRAIDSNYIYSALKDNHDVQFREIVPGEDLNVFDKIIFGMVNITGAYGRGCVHPLQLMADVPVEKVLIFYEDWQLSNALKSYKQFVNTSDEKNIQRIIGASPRFYEISEENFDLHKFMKMINALDAGEYDVLIPGFKWGDKEIYREYMPCKNIYKFDLSPYFIEDFNIINVPFNPEDYKAKMNCHLLNKLGEITKSEIKRMNVSPEECEIFNGSLRSKTIKFDTETDVFYNSMKYKSIMVPKYDHNGSGHWRSRWIFAAFGNGYVISESDNKDFEMLGIPNVNILSLPIEEQMEYVKLLKQQIVANISTKEEVQQALNIALGAKEPIIPKTVEESLFY